MPPSVRPSGPYAGCSYEFIQGTLRDLARLPPLRTGAFDHPTRLRAVNEGRRNNSLFGHLIEQARYCDDPEALLDVGMTFGQHDCDPPLPPAEIAKTVNSVWRMHEKGRLWPKGAEPRLVVPKVAIDALGGDALKFYLKLRLAHFDRRQFAVSPKRMAEAQVIPGWSHHTYRAPRDELVKKGYLKMIHKGGSRPGDPSLFAFSSPPLVMGTVSVPNINKHPPPSSFLDDQDPGKAT